MELIFALAAPVVLVVAVALYCLPIGVAYTRRLEERPMSFVVITDLLFGWTIIGWLVALAVAVLFQRRRYSRKRFVKRARSPSPRLRMPVRKRTRNSRLATGDAIMR